MQNLLDTTFRATWHDFFPDLIFDAFVRIQHAPVRTVFCLEPFEVVDLVVQVLDIFILLRGLVLSISKNFLLDFCVTWGE
jgi:hypothetical protein